MMLQGFFFPSPVSLNFDFLYRNILQTHIPLCCLICFKGNELGRDVDIGQCLVYGDCNVGMLYD